MADASRLRRELGAYGVASAMGLITDMALLALLVTQAHLHYLAAATISFVCGGVVMYVASVTRVFHFRRIGNRALELACFVALGAIGLVVNAAVIYVAVAVGEIHFMAGKLLAAGCTFGTNFLLRRRLLFSPVAHSQPETTRNESR